MNAQQSGESTLDGGPAWRSRLGVSGQTVQSANASVVPLVITDVPAADERVVLDDLEISVDTQMKVTLRSTTGGVVIGAYYLPANSAMQVTLRNPKRAPAVAQSLEVITSVAGNIAVTASYHNEP